MTSTEPSKPQSRIPLGLQAVFLASNRGREVNKPPPGKAGFKVFFRNWLRPRKLGLFNKSKQAPSKNSYHNDASTTTVATAASTSTSKPATAAKMESVIPPQTYLDCMLRSRGYSTKRYKALSSAYKNTPTALQRASYDIHMMGHIRRNNVTALDKAIACGLSPNPCNNHGESFVHMVCRNGNADLLEILLKHGADVQIVDDYGRSPLHDCCWAAEPALDVMKMLLDRDVRLLHMIDARGHGPLKYVREEHWGEVIQFLIKSKDVYWPKDANEKTKQAPPPLALELADSRPALNPANTLSVELTKLVASGKIKPSEAVLLKDEYQTSTGSLHIDDEDDDSSFGSSDEDFSEDSDYTDCSYDEDKDMGELLAELPIEFTVLNDYSSLRD